MNSGLSTFIAVRYFFSKKTQRVINLISMISVIGVTVGTAALIIVLSVFNGFEDLILRLYNSFDPDLKIELAEGKSFSTDKIDFDQLKKIKGIAYINQVVEETALAKYQDKQNIIKLKGVSSDFEKMTGLDSMIVDGRFELQRGDTEFAIVGSGVAYNLGLNPENIFQQIEIYGVKSSSSMSAPSESFNRRFISPSGIFSVQQEFDTRYIIVPLRFAREIFDYENKLTTIEIALDKNADEKETSTLISNVIGKDFTIKNRLEQHKLINKIMWSEKWAVFLILTFILIIAIFNVISSLTMLVIEKKNDIAILRSMGAEVNFLRKIFLIEGTMITFTGAIAGILLGLIICFLQQHFGLIKLGNSGSFVIDAYPVKLNPKDFIYVFITVICIGLIAAWYPARRLISNQWTVVSPQTIDNNL